MNTQERAALLEQFRKEVHLRAGEIDPENSQDWYSLTLGWAVGKGLSAEDAHTFATYVRYQTDLG